jgi:hypothetical protein
VETELLILTQAELKRKTFRLETMINDVSTQRTALAGLLSELMRAKEKRERELDARLAQIQKLRDGEDEDDLFWLVQYQRLLRRQPLEDQLQGLNLTRDARLKTVLMSCDNERVELFLHVFVSNNIFDIDQLADKSEKDLLNLGIEDYELASDIVDNVRRVMCMAMPSAPSAKEDELENSDEEPAMAASAPEDEDVPLDIFCQIECVVCLDSKSNIIFFPCGHVCTCNGCVSTLELCPLCRSTISSKRIFIIHDTT